VTAWTFDQAPAGGAPGAITLIEGTAFCLCSASGEISPGGPEGVYYRDTRLVSRWQLLVDGEPLEPLAVLQEAPYCATFVGRSQRRPDRLESTIMITRARYVGAGLREDISVQNFASEPAGLHISLRVESDLADIFDVKKHRMADMGQRTIEPAGDGLTISVHARERMRGVRIAGRDAIAGPGELVFQAVVPPREVWRNTITARPIIDGHEVPPRFPPDQPITESDPAQRHHAWEIASPTVTTEHAGLRRALRRSRGDLGSLRIFDSDHPDRPPGVAAGAPWFMTLFGRDSLLSSWMALPLDATLALGTVRMLADLQGMRVDPITEEEPGKVMHELRPKTDFGAVPIGSRGAYYGAVDATPLFVMLVDELYRWEADDLILGELLPHVDRALQWIEQFGDFDDDLFVEYQRKTDRGLINQGWKDSSDGINFDDGQLAQAPIALAEVQAYVYGAYLARAHLASRSGDDATRQQCDDRAAALKRAFNERFWLPDRGWYAVGLDRDKRPIDALASNMGHCLLTGIIDADKASVVAEQLMSPEMFSGWGIRTLATSMGAYNPMSYHNGSVWPHDNAIITAGLMRYGFTEQAQRIAMALLDAAETFDGRLPELFCGFDRAQYPRPVPYPTSCSPQAWAAASPLYLVRTLLRFDPCMPCGKLRIAPALPAELGELTVEGLSLDGYQVSLHASAGRGEINGLPDSVQVLEDPAPLSTAVPGKEVHP
jgi:glycogen debranching enzyme